MSVLLGNGNGTFQAAVNYAAGSGPNSVVVGDFNGDGKADLAVTNYSSDNVSVLLGNGNGIFQTAVNYAAGTSPQSVAMGDFDGDGNADLAVANWQRQRERADRQWQRDLPIGGELRSGQLALITWQLGISTGTGRRSGRGQLPQQQFQRAAGQWQRDLPDGGGLCGGHLPSSVAVGDFNGDGRADLVVANYSSNNISVLWGYCRS